MVSCSPASMTHAPHDGSASANCLACAAGGGGGGGGGGGAPPPRPPAPRHAPGEPQRRADAAGVAQAREV